MPLDGRIWLISKFRSQDRADFLQGVNVADTDLTYRAFLSYSHADQAWAKWLHRALEGFRIDKDLVGRQTPRGPVPQSLRPIFRDREDFSGGHSLTDATLVALDASAALIVLCSTVAATRPAVNEEVRLFRARHPDRAVIPVIIDGTWPDNFPPALRFELGADGSVTDRPITILGPDLREEADGKNLGLAKLVAGLTGLSPDDVFRRAERERRRQNRLRMAVAAVIAALAIGGGGFTWQSYRQKQTLTEIAALVDKYSVVSSAAAGPGPRQGLAEAITAIAEGAATDPRYAKALELLKVGKPDQAEPLLKALAEDKEKRADRDAKDAAAAYRHLAAIAAFSDPRRARDYYVRAAQLDPSNIEGIAGSAAFQRDAGQLEAAAASYARVITMATPGIDDDPLFWAYYGIGDIQVQRGILASAIVSFEQAHALADRRAMSAPDDVNWQRHLSTSLQKLGDMAAAQGDLAGALQSYRGSLAIEDRLAKADPADLDGQFELSIALDRVANTQSARGDYDGALISYRQSLVIRDRAAKSSPGNVIWLHALGISYEKVGNAQSDLRDYADALVSYREELAIAEQLIGSDPDNADWRRDRSVALNDVGDMQQAQGDVAAALTSYRDSLAIRDQLTRSDPSNAAWQRDLSLSQNKIGDIELAQGDPSAAIASYELSLAIRQRLAKSDPANAGWQHDLAYTYLRLANANLRAQRKSEAQQFLAEGRAVLAPLVAQHPDWQQWKQDLAQFDQQIAALK